MKNFWDGFEKRAKDETHLGIENGSIHYADIADKWAKAKHPKLHKEFTKASSSSHTWREAEDHYTEICKRFQKAHPTVHIYD